MPKPDGVGGGLVAWTEVSYGKTNGLSSIHRTGENGATLCGAEIPGEIRLFPPLRSLHVCPICEDAHQRGLGLNA